MITNVIAKGYVPGIAVFFSLDIPPDEPTGCHAEYAGRIYQGNLLLKPPFGGVNYNAGSPADDVHVVLSSSEATPQGALLRLNLLAWRGTAATCTGKVQLRQGKTTIVDLPLSVVLKANTLAEQHFDIYCA